jgi:hypothetical protein
MKFRMMATSFLVVMASIAHAADQKSTGRVNVEKAWASGVAAHDVAGACSKAIGWHKAQVLANYCFEFATTLHARCNRVNSCATLTDAIWGYCKQSGWDPSMATEMQPNPSLLPCANMPDAKAWSNLSTVR